MGVTAGSAEYRALHSTAMFKGLAPQVAQEVLSGSVIETCPADAELFHQGDPAEHFFLLLDGWVKVARVLPNGTETVIGVFTRGQAFAEAIAIAGGTYPAAGKTVTKARVIRVAAERIRRIILSNPEIGLAMIASTAQHLHLMMQQIEQLKSRKAPERVAEFLLSLTDTEHGPASIALPFDKMLIAGRLGMQPESLSRAFRKLKDYGIEVDGARVTLASPDALRRAAEDG